MKTSMLTKIAVALAICAAFPLGALAEPAMLRERYGTARLRRLQAEERRGDMESNWRMIVPNVIRWIGYSSRDKRVDARPKPLIRGEPPAE